MWSPPADIEKPDGCNVSRCRHLVRDGATGRRAGHQRAFEADAGLPAPTGRIASRDAKLSAMLKTRNSAHQLRDLVGAFGSGT
jgi:hypothetical protein